MKKFLAMLMATAMLTGVLAACGGGTSSTPAPADNGGQTASQPADEGGDEPAAPSGGNVTLNVVTSYGGDDGNRSAYENGFRGWEAATGNTVNDGSATSNEEWKARILADFETGSEPDVLFFFSGVDANPFVSADKVVPLNEIREEFPDYASHMDDSKMAASPANGKVYAIPTTGYWEGMFVNKNVLEAADVEVPGPNTTWEEFLEMCQKIKDAGYTPIAVSLAEIPHYWFEFCVLNNGNPLKHETLPTDAAARQSWIAGLEDIKELYELGYLPSNTLTATDDETMQMMADDRAAFAIDGSWKVGWFVDNASDLSDFTVTFVPGKGQRSATDMIGGLSMGYYITRKAWEDPDKRAAAVDFINHMTSEEIIGEMAGGTAATALKGGTPAAEDPNSLQVDALAMIAASTGTVPATQDGLSAEMKNQLFLGDVKLVAVGDKTAEEAVDTIVEMLG